MALGVIGVIAGIVVLIDPGGSLVTLAWVAGVFLVVDGVITLVGASRAGGGARSTLGLLGVLWVIVGLYLVIEPISGVLAVAVVLGIWLVVRGVSRLLDAARRGERDRVWNLIAGVVEVIAGLIIVVSPGIGVVTLALFVGLAFLLRGFGEISAAWTLRSAAR